MSDTQRACREEWFSVLMASQSRDRITVDLRGSKAALIARAQGQGVSPSELLRSLLATALADGEGEPANRGVAPEPAGKRVRLSLRMRSGDVVALMNHARATGLSAGDFVAALVNQAPVLAAREGPQIHLAALTQSCNELATLSRSLRHLAALLREGSTRAAQEYRAMLDAVDSDVRAHLGLAATVLAEIRPLVRAPRRDSTPAT
jgi:hypothetical protein